MTLLALQNRFRDTLLAERDEDCAPGMAVYHHAYRAQLVDGLRATFEHTHSWLGDDAMIDAAVEHIERAPPSSWSLDHYGADFATTLAELYPDNAELPELARLEWALAQAFVGPDAEAVSPADLGDVDWDTARLRFVPTLKLSSVATNVGAIWSALANQTQPPMAEALPRSAAIAIWRHEFAPSFRTLEPAEHAALVAAIEGASFAEICAAIVAERGDEGVAEAGGYLGQWIHDGMIAAIVA